MAIVNPSAKLGDIERNYIEAQQFLEEWKRRKVLQLVLLNNMNRGEQNIASTLLVTIFNRAMSSLYDDKIQVKFLPSQGIMQEQLNSFNVLAQSDYLEMGKAKLDYDWCWDTLFFSRGYAETYRFDKRLKLMKPEAINPLVFGYDPYFTDPQEWRYYWKWVLKDKHTINRLIKSGKIKGVTKAEELPGGVEPKLWEYKQRRDAAAKGVEPPTEAAAADLYQILEYYAYNDEGERCAFWIDKHFSKILMEEKLELDDMVREDGSVGSRWPIVVKEAFRVPHSTISFGVSDLLEDKHRAESVLLNLAFIAAKDKANPLYWYDPDKVQDVSQFLSRQVNQHIPVEGDGSLAVGPLNKDQVMDPGLLNFMTMLRQQANDPIGTGVSLEPSGGGQETATEVAIDQQLNDMAQSLISKVLQFGESEFWSHWFHRYQKFGPELGTKMANVVGIKGIDTTEIDFKDFQTTYPPGVMVFSAKEAEYKNLVKRRDWMQLLPQLQASMTPDGFRNWYKHVFMPLMVEDPATIDVMFPETMDEMNANQENAQLKKGQMPPVLQSDNHETHIYTHMMVEPKNWETWMHIQWHKDELAKQKAMAVPTPGMLTPDQQNVQSPMQGPQPTVGAERGSPLEAAAPLKTEAKTPLNKMNNG